MLHDEEIYGDPSAFRPERFLTQDRKLDSIIRDPATVAFGFGRRSDAAHYPLVHVCAEILHSRPRFPEYVQAATLRGLLCGCRLPWFLLR